MSTLSDFTLLRPDTAAEAVRLRAQFPGSCYLAGGTDLLPNMRRGLITAEVVIDLGGLAELTQLLEEADGLWIGARVTLAELASNPIVMAHWAALAQAAVSVAGPTHRTSATLGGNLCLDTRCRFYNQSESWRTANDYCMKLGNDTCRVAVKSSRCFAAFSGDVAPALISLDAEVEILGLQGMRRIPVAEFYRDDGLAWLALAPGELLVGVRVPLSKGWVSGYEKVRIRGSIDFPLAGVAVALLREDEVIGGLRIALTGVSSRPEVIDLNELVGRPLDEAAMTLIERQVMRGTKVMETSLVGVPYRRRIMPILAKRLVGRLWGNLDLDSASDVALIRK
jgi:4-hydroxybenzoyl-CoA reductase subunit beta